MPLAQITNTTTLSPRNTTTMAKNDKKSGKKNANKNYAKKNSKENKPNDGVDTSKFLFAAGILGKKLPTPYATCKEAFERALAWETTTLIRVKPEKNNGKHWKPLKVDGVVLCGSFWNYDRHACAEAQKAQQEKVREHILSGKFDAAFIEKLNSLIHVDAAETQA